MRSLAIEGQKRAARKREREMRVIKAGMGHRARGPDAFPEGEAAGPSRE